MGRKYNCKNLLKVGFFLFFLCVLGGITGIYRMSFAADGEGFFISDKDNVDSSQKVTAITMSTATQSFYAIPLAGFSLESDKVTWEVDDPGIIDIESTQSVGGSINARIRAISPGRTTLTVRYAKAEAGGTKYYTQSVWVTVPLKIDQSQSDIPGFRQLYVDSTDNKLIMAVSSGSALGLDTSVYQLKCTLGTLGPKQNFESSNESVVTVSGGAVKAIGAGSAQITVSTQGTEIQTDTITVYVMPQGRFADGDDKEFRFHPLSSKPYVVSGGAVDIEFDAANVDSMNNIVWIVEKFDSLPQSSSVMGEIVYDELNGITSDYVTGVQAVYNDITQKAIVTVRAKTGFYRVRGILRDLYEGHTLEVMLTRPISNNLMYFDIDVAPNLRKDTYITMNVGDVYDILGGFNVPIEDIGNYFETTNGNYYTELNISPYLSLNKETGKVTALKSTVTTDISQNTYRVITMESKDLGTVSIHIRVIDNFTLNASDITLVMGAEFKLYAIDNSSPITWSTDPEKQTIISIEDGVVKALKVGTVTVIATQYDDQGVAKTAKCKITVTKSATSIVLDPAKATVEVGEYKTILAKVSPASNILPSLKWISSDEKVVEITDSSAVTAATVLAKAPGLAVITAINTDNIILGSCVITVEQKITAIKFPQDAITLPLSMGQLQMTPTYTPANATATNLKWTSTKTKVATISSNGLLTLKSVGETVISVQSEFNPSVIAYCTVTVTTSITGIYLDETQKTLQVGESCRLTYYTTPKDATASKITWSALDKSVANVKDGTVTASKAGQTYIMVKTASGATAMCLLTVEQKVAGIKLNTNSLSLQVGDVYYANATLTPATSTDRTVTWKSKNAKIASVTNEGKITAISAGTTTITAATNNNLSAEIEVTVEQPVKGVSLNYKSQTILVGANFELKAVIEPAKSTNERVTWNSDDSSIATVSAAGVVTGITAGTTLVTCTTNDGGYKASCVVIVKEPVTSLTLNKKNKKLGIGKTFKIVATVDSNAATNSRVSWTTSNNKVCRITNVSTDGNTATVKTLRKGKAEVICKTTDGSRLTATCGVKSIKLVSDIKLNKSYSRLLEGKSIKLKAKIKPKKATQKKVTWTSDNPDIAYVNTNGKVLALKEGEATITAGTGDYKVNGKKSAVCKISVYAKIPATSILTGQKDIIMIKGGKETISATVTPADTTDKLKFTSDNPRVASVNKRTGAVTAVSTGTATITITSSSGKQTTVGVTVVGLNYTSCTLEQYDTFQLKLEAGGNEGDYNVSWNSSNPAVATVSQNGLVTGKMAGTTVITAYVNGASLTCNVRVNDIR